MERLILLRHGKAEPDSATGDELLDAVGIQWRGEVVVVAGAAHEDVANRATHEIGF